MPRRFQLASFLIIAAGLPDGIHGSVSIEDGDDNNVRTKERLDLWSRGAFDLDWDVLVGSQLLSTRMAPVSYVRQEVLQHHMSPHCDVNGYCRIRGGASESGSLDYGAHMEKKIEELGARFGSEFMDAIERNKKEHEEDCRKSCEMYFCADPESPLVEYSELVGETSMKSYSMGPVPPAIRQ